MQSIISPAKDPFRTQDNNAYRKEVMIKRSNLDEQASKRFDKNIDLKAMFDDPEQKETKFLAQKLANEALESPQLQRNIKKLVNLSGTLCNHSKGIKGLPVDRMKSVLERTISTRKPNKLSNRKEKEKKKRNKRKHGLKRHEEYPWSCKQNQIKVSKRKMLYEIP